jgi:uncharacterized protein YfkK (UPF0435 family)
MALVSCMVYMVIDKPSIIYKDSTETCKEDSLQTVINQMEVDLEMFDEGWDYKEKRYEEVLFEYEYALDRLKNYHPEAYRDIHRILAHKENFSRRDEKENKKRMSINKF